MAGNAQGDVGAVQAVLVRRAVPALLSIQGGSLGTLWLSPGTVPTWPCFLRQGSLGQDPELWSNGRGPLSIGDQFLFQISSGFFWFTVREPGAERPALAAPHLGGSWRVHTGSSKQGVCSEFGSELCPTGDRTGQCHSSHESRQALLSLGPPSLFLSANPCLCSFKT